MKIENEFSVGVPIDTAWEVLTDLESIAPCLPGAVLTGRDGDNHLGRVKVRLGPVTSEFSGQAHFVELDADDHRAVIHAQGRELRGGGNAQVTIVARLSEHEGRTVVGVDADLRIAGKIAQFGSGLIQQVSTTLLGEFATRLEHELTASEPETDDAAAPASPDPVPRPDAEALDVLGHARVALPRRVPPAALVCVGLGVIVLVATAVIRRSRPRRSGR